ncbi:hypothetical protein ABFU82_15005 [Nocardioides sp. WV_118_6]
MIELQLLVAYFLLSCATYLVWPSRWNIPAHVALGFWVVAYLVPIGVVGTHRTFAPGLTDEYADVLLGGAIAFTVGVVLGTGVAPRSTHLFGRIARTRFAPGDEAVTRTAVVTVAAIAVLLFAMLRMGFVPMFADDPLAAKFFRGAYGEAYRPVAIPYRVGTGILPLLLPILAAFALRAEARARVRWWFLLGVALLLMLLTLQRGPAATGLLLLVGVLLAGRRRPLTLVTTAVAVYVGGALFYVALGWLGLVESPVASGPGLAASIAASTPDVSDGLGFLQRWHQHGEPLTAGRTFLGGLVPGNFRWNPGVWTVALGDDAVRLQQLNTGGLRLASPVWGLVSLGPVGVVLVPLLSGIVAGSLTAQLRRALDSATDLVARTWLFVAHAALAGVLVEFMTIGYIGVLQLVAGLWIIGRPRADREEARCAA